MARSITSPAPAPHRRQAGHGLGEGPEARLGGVRAVLAVGGDSQDDERRVGCTQVAGGEVPALERAWAEVLDEDVELGDPASQQVLAFGAAQIEGDTALASAQCLPVETHAVLLGPEAADVIAGSWHLDLDDVGSVVTQDGGRERGGDHGREVQHAQAVQEGLALGRVHDRVHDEVRRLQEFMTRLSRPRSNSLGGIAPTASCVVVPCSPSTLQMLSIRRRLRWV